MTLDGTVAEFVPRRTVVFLLLGALSRLGEAAGAIRAEVEPADGDVDWDAMAPTDRELIELALGVLALDDLTRRRLTEALSEPASEPGRGVPVERPRELLR